MQQSMYERKRQRNEAAAIEQDGIVIKGRLLIGMTAVLLLVIIAAGMLTQMLPIGRYDRVTDEAGIENIVPGSYTVLDDSERLPVWRWFTAPFELFASTDNLSTIVIILYLLIVGGSFLVLDRCGVMRHLLWTLNRRFSHHRYKFMAVLVFICMLMGSVAGLFEESVVFVPIAVALALSFGWDSLTGLGMSVLAVNFGFSVGLFNPFSLVNAQEAAGLQAYSGLWLRIVSFAVVYGILMLSLVIYVRRIEKKPERSSTRETDSQLGQRYLYDVRYNPFTDTRRLDIALAVFLCSFIPIIGYIAAACFSVVPSDYILPVMMVSLMLGGVIAGSIASYKRFSVPKNFFAGMVKVLPAMIPIVLAMSVKVIIENGGVFDTILHSINEYAVAVNPYYLIIAVYLFVLAVEFFISSASAKAALLIPLLLPLTDLAGISRQSTVLTFLFADGFANMLMPTDACLLVVLGMVGVTYGKWARWALPLQVVVFVVTIGISMLSVYLGYR